MDGAIQIPDPQELVRSPTVRLAALPGQSDTAVILLRSFNPKLFKGQDRDPKVAYPLAEYVWAGGARHVLVVQDLQWGWLSAPGVKAQLVRGLKRYFDHNNISRVFAVGTSAGGAVLMDLCGDVKIDALLAISPQTDLNAAYRAFDRRQLDWQEWVEENAELPNPWRAFESETHLTILHGLRGPDGAHAAICPQSPKLQHFLFPDMDHNLKDRIGGANRGMRRMVDHLCAMDFDGMKQLALEKGAFLRGQVPTRSNLASEWEPCPKSGTRVNALREGHTIAEA